MATLTKMEKAASGKEGSEEKDDECNEKRETRNQNTSRGEKSSGRWHDLLSTICRRVSSLPSFPSLFLSLSFSLPPVKTRIFHSDVRAARRVIVAAVNEDAAIKCCAAGSE